MTPDEREQQRQKFFENLPVFKDSTPMLIRPQHRPRIEVILERLASPIWHVLYRLAGK